MWARFVALTRPFGHITCAEWNAPYLICDVRLPGEAEKFLRNQSNLDGEAVDVDPQTVSDVGVRRAGILSYGFRFLVSSTNDETVFHEFRLSFSFYVCCYVVENALLTAFDFVRFVLPKRVPWDSQTKICCSCRNGGTSIFIWNTSFQYTLCLIRSSSRSAVAVGIRSGKWESGQVFTFWKKGKRDLNNF